MESDKNYTEGVNYANNNVQNPVFNFPIGYRFVPQDDELITYYLKPKIANEPIPVPFMHDANIYEHGPEDLTKNFTSCKKDEWYFFTPRDRKYPNGSRPSRAAGNGYWKATGRDKNITDDLNLNEIIGVKKTLVYYEGEPGKGTKSKWSMNEYRVYELSTPENNGKDMKVNVKELSIPKRINGKDMKLDDCILCRIYKKTKPEKKSSENERADPAVDVVVLETNPAVDDHQPSSDVVIEENETPENNNENLEDVIISGESVNSYFASIQDLELVDGSFAVNPNSESYRDIQARFDQNIEGASFFEMMTIDDFPHISQVWDTWDNDELTFDPQNLGNDNQFSNRNSDVTTAERFLNDVPHHEEEKPKKKKKKN